MTTGELVISKFCEWHWVGVSVSLAVDNGTDPRSTVGMEKQVPDGVRVPGQDQLHDLGRLGALVAAEPNNARARRLLARALRRLGRHEEAARAEAEAIRISANSPALLEIARAMRAQQAARAEQLLRSYLATDPDDPQALRMLAEIAAVCGYGDDAERLLRQALQQAPGFIPLYVNLAALLQDLERTDEAVGLLDHVLENSPANPLVLSIKAGILAGARRLGEALAVQEQLLVGAPDMANAWTNYADMLKAAGRANEAIAAYRKSLTLEPAGGEAWWGLASSGLAPLSAADVAAIEATLDRPTDDLNQMRLNFALGRALADQGRFEASFRRYEAANAMRGRIIPYDPRAIEDLVDRAVERVTPDLLARRAGQGAPDAGPIFIVGMPRSGSTLVEQILSSHPSVEGLGELHDLDRIVARLVPPGRGHASWLDALESLSGEDMSGLGERYLAAARGRRNTDRPFFTDKMPANWIYVGLIAMILPNARIIDVRRHPVACCFSNFALNFNRLTAVPSSLADLGRHYRAYVRMMAHLEAIQPGRIHRLVYEDLVADPERELRSLLAHLALPFDAACLRFHESRRDIYTPSAQQVRRPVNRDGLDHWRNYKPWLGPLTEALGREAG